jgi:hypothetical protein
LARRNPISERQKGFRLELDLEVADHERVRSRLQEAIETLRAAGNPVNP